MDNSGTHCGKGDTFKIELNDRYNLSKINIIEDVDSKRKIKNFLNQW
jgi:hypothetical protein